ncbi:hypothetical protein AURDEDRAFT_174146 [Auricularia subglabra TFB-10046 SS5]|nr:hypothetical protein AURDEDRAFT_174146 [Auricularia subglabra TFB-10046 SS5]
MSATVRRLRSERVQEDAASLADVEASLEKTLARQTEAQRVLDDLTREASVLEEIRGSLAARLAVSRSQLIRLCIAALPNDILRCIFEQAISAIGPDACFTLAAVCSQWRTVALDQAPLWSTIRVFPSRNVGLALMEAYYDCVVTRLSRSRVAPLDIFVLWLRPSTQEDWGETIQTFMRILDVLGSNISRWRDVQLYLPTVPELDDRSAFESLKGPTPLLTNLVLKAQPGGPDSRPTSRRGYLPYAPVLRRMKLMENGLGCAPHSTFPALTKLHLGEGTCTDNELYDYLCRASSLVELDLDITIAHPPHTDLYLPELRSLNVGAHSQSLLFEPASSLLHMPKVAHLFLDCLPDDAMTSFLDAVSPTVRRLRLCYRLKKQHLAILQRLQNIEELRLSYLPLKPIGRSALDQLASTDPPIWPRLTTLWDVMFVTGLGDHLLGLVAARNPTPGVDGNDPRSGSAGRPCRLREITFRNPAPEWLVQELDRLLRL